MSLIRPFSSHRLLMTRVACVVVALGTAAGCSSETAAPAATVEPTTTTSSPPTTAPTTTAPPTTAAPPTAPPTSSQAEIEAELIRVVEGSASVFAPGPVDPDAVRLDDFYAGQLLSDLLSAFQDGLADGEVFAGSYQILEFSEVTTEGNVGRVFECAIDGVAVLDSSGSEIVAADTVAFLRVHDLQLTESGWRVVNTSFPGTERQVCEGS